MPNEDSKVVRVEVEEDDGTIRMLIGEEATRYAKQLHECLLIASVHGTDFKPENFNWLVTNKYPAPGK
jgi:hypothetical protein